MQLILNVNSTKELDSAIAEELKANKPELAIATLLKPENIEEDNDDQSKCK